MHHEALGSAVVTGGIGGILGIVFLMLTYILRIARMSRRSQRYTSNGWSDEAQGGDFRPRETDAAPAALSAEEQKRRDRAHAYWAAEQPPEGTLSAGGVIGEDIAPPADGARDPGPAGQ
jgi:hypothetical protein